MRRVTGFVFAVMLASIWSGAAASAKSADHGQMQGTAAALVLHSRFHLVASRASSFTSDGRYALVADPSGTTLIDDQTGRRTLLTPPALCGYTYLVGGGRALASCAGYGNPPYQIYSIATGAWTAVNSSGGMPVALGSDWIEYFGTTEPGCIEHCSYQYVFGRISTGQLRGLPEWAPGATTIPDLNSPALAAQLCSPLRVPQGFPNDMTASALAPDPLIFAGPFAAGAESVIKGGLYQLRLLLQRCGSKLHRVLTSQLTGSPTNQFAINHHALVWLDYRGGPIHGIFLPSLRKFTIVAPLTSPGGSVFLTSHSLYLHDGSGRVIATPSPRPPTHHRHHKR